MQAMKPPLRVLLVEDCEEDALLLLRELGRAGWELVHRRVETRDGLHAALGEGPWDVVLSDFVMPAFSGLHALHTLAESGLDLPFILVSGQVGEENAVELMRAGARDFITKGNLSRLAPAIERELREARARRERRRALEELETLSSAIHQSPVAVSILDAAGKVEFVNPHFTRMTGYLPAEVRGRSLRFLYADETPAGALRELWLTVTAGQVWHGELRGLAKDGAPFWEKATMAPVRNRDGALTHFVAIAEDVTERRHLEDQLRHSQKMEAVGTLAGGVAHDFNNLLMAIMGYAELMKMQGDADHRLQPSLDAVLASCERGAGLTRSLLAFSRKQPIALKPVNLNRIVGDLEKLLRRLIGEDIQLTTVLSGADMVVTADAGQLEQVLMNFVTNARDAMPAGGSLRIATEEVVLSAEEAAAYDLPAPGRYAALAVADTGVGMDPATREKIFEPFFTTKEPGKGTGLGLATVYGIVRRHGGSIGLESEPGQGTTFRVFLPLSSSDSDDAHAAVAPHPQGGTETILFAEDDREVRTLTSLILESFGYRVIPAANGVDAIERFTARAHEVDLILLDAVMPKKGGREVYEAVRALRPEVRVIFLSGYTADLLEGKGVDLQGVPVLFKPVNPLELLRRVRLELDAPNPQHRADPNAGRGTGTQGAPAAPSAGNSNPLA